MSQVQVRQRYNSPYQPSLYNDAVQTITYLQKLKRDEPTFAVHYEAWRDHRELTIDTIDDLQKHMDRVCVGSNVVQCVGAAAGIVGLISGITGIFLEANKDESAEDFKKFGKYCSGAGIAAVASSTLIEASLNQSAINKINRILEKDMELTEPLKNWIKFSTKVEDCLNRLFQCDISSTIFTNVVNVCKHCVLLLVNGEAELQNLLPRLQSCTLEGFGEVPLQVMQKVYHSLKGIQRNPGLLQPLEEICRILDETPYTLEFAKIGGMISKTCDILGAEPLTMMLSATGLDSTFLGKCALDTIAIVSHVVRIIFAINNIKEAKSKYSDSLDQLKLALSMELMDITSKMNARDRRSYLNYENIHRIGY